MAVETLTAAEYLTDIGIGVDVVWVTGPVLQLESVQARRGLADAPTWILDAVYRYHGIDADGIVRAALEFMARERNILCHNTVG